MNSRVVMFVALSSLMSGCVDGGGIGRPGSPAWEATASEEVKNAYNERENSRYAAISKSTSVPVERARSICAKRAKSAGDIAASNYRPANTAYATSCTKDYFGNYDCGTTSYTQGGKWTGLQQGFEKSSIARRVSQGEFESCMMQFGFYEQ